MRIISAFPLGMRTEACVPSGSGDPAAHGSGSRRGPRATGPGPPFVACTNAPGWPDWGRAACVCPQPSARALRTRGSCCNCACGLRVSSTAHFPFHLPVWDSRRPGIGPCGIRPGKRARCCSLWPVRACIRRNYQSGDGGTCACRLYLCVCGLLVNNNGASHFGADGHIPCNRNHAGAPSTAEIRMAPT